VTCRHLPRTSRVYLDGGYECLKCGRFVAKSAITRGRTVRQYGIAAELDAARRYGGRKTNDGGPVDITGEDWDTQMRTRRTDPPAEWTKAFAIMPGKKLRRLLIRYVQGPGRAPVDYYVIPAMDFLSWYGKDGDPQ
jgi:hypothetical protein